jgi:nucleoside-diphosphate-sugar epimerase
MSGKYILLTGATGHVGFASLVNALSNGYKVRAAVRRDASIAQIKSPTSIQPYLSQLEFVIVPDITVDGAYDEAVKGVDAIVHIASPMTDAGNDYQVSLVTPAVQGTLNILNSAIKSPSVKRIVITSSIVAIVPPEVFTPGFDRTITADDEPPSPGEVPQDYFMAYMVSKQLAYRAALDWFSKSKPSFDVIHIMPSFVVGRNELVTTREKIKESSNANALVIPLGEKRLMPTPGVVVHIDDVAEMHVAALSPKVKGNESYIATYGSPAGIQWSETQKILAARFPQQIKQGIFSNDGEMPTMQIKVDTSKSEKAFGMKFKSYEDALVDLAEWYVAASA